MQRSQTGILANFRRASDQLWVILLDPGRQSPESQVPNRVILPFETLSLDQGGVERDVHNRVRNLRKDKYREW
jgi:hypothetical protein